MKKRILSIVLCMVILLTIFMSVPLNVSASSYDFELEGIRYASIDDNSVEIVGYNPNTLPVDLVIPETVEGKTVIKIGDSGFNGANIKSVVLPDSLHTIGAEAFRSCESISSIKFPKGLKTIGVAAFIRCTSLEEVTINSKLQTISERAFALVDTLKNVIFEERTTPLTIGFRAFYKCSGLTDFDFSSVSYIDRESFAYCTGLTSVVLPEGIDITCAVGLFEGCTNIKTAKFPDSAIRLPDCCFYECTSLESVETGELVDYIGNNLFYNCINLKYISFAKDNNASYLGGRAFYGCELLTEMSLPNVTFIQYSSFENCYNLSKVTLSEDLEYVGEKAFYNCHYLAEVSLSGVERISDKAFENCYSLSEVTFKEGLKELGERVFFNCFSLYEIYIPKTTETIGSMALGCFEEEELYYVYTDFTVIGDPDSLAYKYAEAYGIKYALSDVQLSSISNTADGIKITFEKVSGFSGQYRIYRKTADTSWTSIANITSNTYTDKTAVSGVYYTYTVKFIGYDGTESRYDKNGLSITRLTVPSVTKIQNTEKGVKLTIEKVEGAAYYRVYYKTSDGWKGIDNTDTTTFVHESAKSGESYTYTVKAFDKFENSSSFNSNGWSNTFIATPQIASVTSTEKGVKITWDKIDGAVNYRVYYKNGSDWKGIGNTTSTTFTHTDATPGVKYTYTVRCMKSDGKTAVSDYSKQGKSHTYFYRGSMASMHKAMQKIKSNNSAVEPAQKSSSTLKPQAIKSELVATIKQATQQLYSKLRGFAKR